MKNTIKTLAVYIKCRDDLGCLKENIEYHTLIGVEHFFIYDDSSETPLREALSDYNNVTVIFCDKELRKPWAAQNHCFDTQKDNYKWIAFIDTDEFIVMSGNCLDLKEYLVPYENYGGLLLWWRTFGSSGHKKIQPSVIDAYTQCNAYGGPSTKTILRTAFSKVANNCVHSHTHTEDYPAVFPDFSLKPRLPGQSCANAVKKEKRYLDNFDIWINHYIIRSREDYDHKIKRYKKNRNPQHQGHAKNLTKDYWAHFDAVCKWKNTAIIDLRDKIKKNNK